LHCSPPVELQHQVCEIGDLLTVILAQEAPKRGQGRTVRHTRDADTIDHLLPARIIVNLRSEKLQPATAIYLSVQKPL
jgi:hypothetical protein